MEQEFSADSIAAAPRRPVSVSMNFVMVLRAITRIAITSILLFRTGTPARAFKRPCLISLNKRFSKTALTPETTPVDLPLVWLTAPVRILACRQADGSCPACCRRRVAARLLIRAEFFNLFYRVNFNSPATNFSGTGFSRINLRRRSAHRATGAEIRILTCFA